MGLLSWIIRGILFLFVFRLVTIVLRAFFGGLTRGSRAPAPQGGPPREPRGQVEELVRDPICGVHTARSSAVPGRFEGGDAYFCSEECASKARAHS